LGKVEPSFCQPFHQSIQVTNRLHGDVRPSHDEIHARQNEGGRGVDLLPGGQQAFIQLPKIFRELIDGLDGCLAIPETGGHAQMSIVLAVSQDRDGIFVNSEFRRLNALPSSTPAEMKGSALSRLEMKARPFCHLTADI
jgi:hypothetical protein